MRKGLYRRLERYCGICDCVEENLVHVFAKYGNNVLE